MKNIIIGCSLLILIATNSVSFSQNIIQGTFQNLAHQTIKLKSHNGFKTYTIASAEVGEKGGFELSYSSKDYGIGFLESEDKKQFSLILNNEKIILEGIDLEMVDAIKTIESFENKIFDQYMNEHLQREQAMAGWDYLKRIYQHEETLFSDKTEPQEAITKERKRIQQEDIDFLIDLPKESYVSWYLPIRKLISSVSTIAQYRTEEIPETTEAFRKIDYSDNRLYKSGMLKDVLESQIWFIENSGYEQEEMYEQMGKSIDAILESLVTDEKRYNEITNHLFRILESRSLFQASEYLALKVLNDQSCTIDNNLANQLESYRAMKIGNQAPEIAFKGEVRAPTYDKTPKKLSEIKSDYTVLVFGASWCPACQEELGKIHSVYKKWKKNNVEVVFISLDIEEEEFKNFTDKFQFISFTDHKKWKSETAKNYHIFATPTVFLLDKTKKIILRPNSVAQMDSWVDWYLVEGNPLPAR